LRVARISHEFKRRGDPRAIPLFRIIPPLSMPESMSAPTEPRRGEPRVCQTTINVARDYFAERARGCPRCRCVFSKLNDKPSGKPDSHEPSESLVGQAMSRLLEFQVGAYKERLFNRLLRARARASHFSLLRNGRRCSRPLKLERARI